MALIVGIVLAQATGCGRHAAHVTGRVTLDGNELPQGANGGVAFHPTQGGAPACGTLAADGTFTLSTGSADGLDPGKYRVTMTVLGPLPPKLPDGTQNPGAVLSGASYRDRDKTEFEVEVVSGNNHYDFDLKPAPKR